MCLNSSTSESMQESDGDCRIYRTSGWCLVYVVFERKAREFQSCLYLILSLQSLICTTRKSLEHQRLNVHSNITKTLTPTLEHRYIHALCNFRMDQHDRFVKEISRVEDVLHRTRPLAKTKNKTLLWHFPFLRDGHCRIYESSANMPMTRLCHDKSTWCSSVEFENVSTLSREYHCSHSFVLQGNHSNTNA